MHEKKKHQQNQIPKKSSMPEGNWMWCVFTTCRDMNPGALLSMVHVENVKERNLR